MSNVQWQTTLSDDANTDDTLRAIIALVNIYSHDSFAQGAVKLIKDEADKQGKSFLQMLFQWACDNVDYKLDQLGTEVVATPALSTLNGLADCKKYAILLGSILEAAGIEPIFKHVEYDDSTPWTHIYIIISLSDFDPYKRSTYVVLDPTNDCRFDSEVSYKAAQLYYLNGSMTKLVAMGGKQKEMGFTSPYTPVPNGWGHSIGSAAHSIISAMPNAGNTDSLAVQRGAALTLISNNVGGIADMMAANMSQNPDIYSDKWAALGGHPNDLKEIVLQGAGLPAAGVHAINYNSAKTNTVRISGGLDTRFSAVGAGATAPQLPPPNVPAHYAGTGTAAWLQSTGNKYPALNPPLVDPNAQNLLNIYIDCVLFGQDKDGYYGWIANGNNYWTGADADAELRKAYADLLGSGVPQGFAGGIVPNAGPLPVPYAKGQDPTKTGTGGSGAPAWVGTLVAVGAGALNTVVPGAGTVVGGIVGGMINSGAGNAGGGGGANPYTGGGLPINSTPGDTSNPQPAGKASVGGFGFGTIFIGLVLSPLFHIPSITYGAIVCAISITGAFLTHKLKR